MPLIVIMSTKLLYWIGAAIGGVPLRLLGRHISGCAHYWPRAGGCFWGFDRTGNAEVHDFDVAVAVDH